VTAGSQPRLVALIAEAAPEPPDEIAIALAPAIEVVELRRNRRALVLGLALLGALSEPDLRALVAGDDDAEAQRRLEARAADWEDYSLNRLVPAFDAGRRPPILEGFADGAPSAAALLDDIPALEEAVVASIWSGRLEPMAWSEFGDVYLAGARQNVAEFSDVLAGVTAGDLGETVTHIEPLARQVQRRLPTSAPEDVAQITVLALADGLVVALADAGWEVTSDLGQPLRCRQGEHELEPLDDVFGLAEGTLSPAAWAARTHELGIAGLPLG
jgi:hypothetical protein